MLAMHLQSFGNHSHADLVLNTHFLLVSHTLTFMHLADAFIQSNLQLH